MISQYINRKQIVKYLTGPIVKTIAKTGINPNYITTMAVVFAAIASYFIYSQDYVLGLIFIMISASVDIIDGGVARLSGRITKFGSYFDASIDRYVEVLIHFGFVFAFPVEAFLAITGSMLLSHAKARVAIDINIDNSDWPAIGERADRFLLLIIGMLGYLIFQEIGGYSLISITLYVSAIVTYFGGIQRMLYGKKLIEERTKT